MFHLSMATVVFLLWGFFALIEARAILMHLDLKPGVSPDDRPRRDDLSGEWATPGKR
ncbi:MAG: hypothetical protein H6R07_1727 [Proteobacteria bacterium]|nr:hypothetical protein [Pseudomonadota bacterium]